MFKYDKSKLIANGENYSNLKELLQELVDNLHIEVSGGQVKLGVIVGGALSLDSNKVLRATNSDQQLVEYCYYGTDESGDYGIQVYNNVEFKGVFGGGYRSGSLNIIDYIRIFFPGNAHDFGDLTIKRYYLAATSNGTNDRGVFGGGYEGGYGGNYLNTIDYITISSPGNAQDFSDLTISRNDLAATSNGTNNRGVFGGGYGGNYLNTIDYITISSPGNAHDFGDLTIKRWGLAATSNGTNDRGVFGGGRDSNDDYLNVIDYITISSPGNAHDFGDLTIGRSRLSATSNGTNDRGVFGGGYNSGYRNDIDYITISSPGNASDFGDLTVKRTALTATSNNTNDRGVFGGGRKTNNLNTIDYITIPSPGNAKDFGDLTVERWGLAATSNA